MSKRKNPLCVNMRREWKALTEKKCFAHTFTIARGLISLRAQEVFNARGA
jgi:hypothetical protein